jgi:hypothetical protein
MRIIVKELVDENHVYLFDDTLRPLKMDVVNKRKTKTHIKNMMRVLNISQLDFVSKIDFGSDED